MTDRKCRWGILSTATIARKNWQAIRNTGNATLIAVASRDVERSQRFIDECQGNQADNQQHQPRAGKQAGVNSVGQPPG